MSHDEYPNPPAVQLPKIKPYKYDYSNMHKALHNKNKIRFVHPNNADYPAD